MQSVIQIQAPLEFFATISKKQDDFYDFAEDYEPVKAFFSGEQQQIFMRALDMLAIYDDSKTYIVDEELETIVKQMRTIVYQDKPYGNIPKLPDLRQKFMDVYSRILEREEAPVLDSIDQASRRVLDVLETKEYVGTKRDSYMSQFREIRNGAEHCNNVSSLRSFADKADALKLRLLTEMDHLDAQIAQKKAAEEAARLSAEAKKNGTEVPVVAEPKTEYKVRKTKNVSIKQMTGTASWRLESAEDIDKYIAELRKTLAAQMDGDTIVNVEF
jgi:Txe/YoeB family toxin of Txe-Axe toxin-antitoxin module